MKYDNCIREYSITRPLTHANVRLGPPHTVCQINAVLLSYFWTVIPGCVVQNGISSVSFASEEEEDEKKS
ncbi:hypothetical protein PSHT_06465 [Puccinia striiformis]|uniref:Uncharacterized protein n=1 Tax=Puccinia striiformis TaxID=27350 RepID=A0A2S4W5R3_9BASI|nr:hypothetical protein PSHT_06465 [Puccinia striiformis]